MGTPTEDVADKVNCETLQQKQDPDPDTGTNISESNEKGSMSADVSGELHKRLSPDDLEKASQSNQDEIAHPMTCQEVSGEVQLRKNVDGGIEKQQQQQVPDTVTNRADSQNTCCESMLAEVVPDELHKRLSHDPVAKASQSNQGELADLLKCQEASGEVQPRRSVGEGVDVTQSNQEDSSLSKVPEKESENLDQKKDPESVGGASESKKSVEVGIGALQTKEDSFLPKVSEKVSENVHQKKDLKSDDGASDSSRVSVLPKKEQYIESCISDSPVKDRKFSLVPGKASDSSQQIHSQKMEVDSPQSDQEQVIYSVRPEKALDKLQPRRNPDMSIVVFPSDQASAPSRAPEKPSEDGYNWRKYGQKLVRGNEFTRSYYKCTYPNCLAKKQVERSHDGHITNIHYIAKHEHPEVLHSPRISPSPLSVAPLQMRQLDMATGTQCEGEKSTALGQTCQSIRPSESQLPPDVVSAGGGAKDIVMKPHKSGDEADYNIGPDSKRQKKEVPRSNDTPPIKSHSEQRHIVQTMSKVDIVNDGYRWRKYGQKLVKGNPNPRSYYRCSSAGCPAKKHVERASHDPKLVITAYEGHHVHDIPPSRTVMQKPAGPDSNTSGEPTSESGENKHVGVGMVVQIAAD